MAAPRRELGRRVTRVLRAGRWLLATYGRFTWLCGACALFLVASGLVAELADRVSHAALIGLALGVLVAAYPLSRRDQLKAGSHRKRQRHAHQSI